MNFIISDDFKFLLFITLVKRREYRMSEFIVITFFQKSQLAKNDSDLSSDSLPSDVSDSEDDKSPFKLKVGYSSEKKNNLVK